MHYNSRSLMFADWRIWLLASMLPGVGFTVAAAAEPVGPPVIRRALPLDGQQVIGPAVGIVRQRGGVARLHGGCQVRRHVAARIL